MHLSRNLLSWKRNYLFGLILLSFILVVCGAFNMSRSKDFDKARREILLRRIGHELLLQSGDSTSRVLPVLKIAENEYQISFENELSFQADSLVNTTRRLLGKDPLSGDYVVNVLNSSNSRVAYGYAISKNKKDDIVACIGRKQPKARYIITIKFKPSGISNELLLGGLPAVAFVGFIFLRSFKGRNTSGGNYPNSLAVGAIRFDVKNRTLMLNGKTADLTRTETRVLHIFALSPNQTIERSRLQKEIWEDEGVIVGRSLDMFISKLRKKLELDPHIKIEVVRGKGYKLNLDS